MNANPPAVDPGALFTPLALQPYRPDEHEREALLRLSKAHGPGERLSAVLALLLTAGSARERQAWAEETEGLACAAEMRATVRKLSVPARVPAWERLLRETARAPLAERRAMVASARRVMSADGQIRPLDRLRWLVMRHLLAEPTERGSSGLGPGGTDGGVVALPEARRRDLASFTAFLARLVPAGDARALVGAAGAEWYRSVVTPWWPGEAAPPCTVPDIDGLAHAIWGAQELPWMLRPQVVRTWVNEAATMGERGRLEPEAAEALRLACVLLDTPMPPALSACFARWDD
jgi:hypothetical protein